MSDPLQNLTSSTPATRWERIQNAYQQAGLRESQKTFSERLTEPITGFLGVAKGVGKSALKFLESGWHASPVGMTVDQCLEIKKQITDPAGWKAEKQAQQFALRQKVLEVWNAPEGIANHLLENAKDSATDHSVHFLNASQFERMETFGELAGEIAPFFIGTGEARAASEVAQVGRELKAVEGLAIKAERAMAPQMARKLEESLEITPIEKRLQPGITLKFDRSSKTWTSPAGLKFGKDLVYKNRIQHVLSHLKPAENCIKKTHTIFSVGRKELLSVLDEAWSKRGSPVFGDPDAFVVPLYRFIGTQDEMSIRMIVRNGSDLITAYPWPEQ